MEVEHFHGWGIGISSKDISKRSDLEPTEYQTIGAGTAGSLPKRGKCVNETSLSIVSPRTLILNKILLSVYLFSTFHNVFFQSNFRDLPGINLASLTCK